MRHEQRLLRLLILGRSHGHDVRDVLPTDNHAAGMHTGVAHIALQFLRVFQRVAQDGVRTVGRLLQLGHDLNGRLERVHAVGDQLSQPIRLPEW